MITKCERRTVKNMSGNTADEVLKILADWGVRSMYGVSGDAVFPLLDAVSRQSKIKYYAAAVETGAAFMAAYEAKLTGHPGVCIATSGPGSANLVNGLAEAYYDGAPVLAITGQAATGKLGTNTKQYFNQQQLFTPFTRMSELVVSPEAVGPVLVSALETAVNEKTVTHLSIPVDIWQMPAGGVKRARITGRRQIVGSGFAGGLEETAVMLNNAQRPVIIIGTRDGQTAGRCLFLADKRGAGIIVAQQAKGVIPDDNPLVMGGIGEAYVPQALSQADFFLLVGAAAFELKFLPLAASIMQLSDSPDALHYDRIDSGMIGSPGQLLKLLIEKIPARRDRKGWLDEISADRENLTRQLAADADNGEIPVHPGRLIAALNRTLAADAIIACDIGSFGHWFDRGFQARQQTVLLSSRWRSMGAGLPAAIAAKISCPEKQVIALVGDGGLLMSMPELLTAVKYRLPVTVVVANNHEYALETARMQAQGLTPFGNNILTPDFAAYAKAAGAHGYRVEDSAQLESTLTEAFGSNEPTVVDVQVSNPQLPNLQ